jgi:DnaK suppressor protein
MMNKCVDGKEGINHKSLTYFEARLRQWHQNIMQDTADILQSIQEETHPQANPIDQAATHQGWRSNFHLLRSKESILQEIEAALHRIAEGTYGYSELSGDPIEIRRLEAWPIARYTLTEEEELQRKAKLYA